VIDVPPYTPAAESSYTFNRHSGIKITRVDELENFSEQGFKTLDEIERDRDYQLTRRIGYASIIVSVLVSLITTYFNWKTYTTERKVTITAMPQSLEPISVKIVNPPNLANGLRPTGGRYR